MKKLTYCSQYLKAGKCRGDCCKCTAKNASTVYKKKFKWLESYFKVLLKELRAGQRRNTIKKCEGNCLLCADQTCLKKGVQ